MESVFCSHLGLEYKEGTDTFAKDIASSLTDTITI